jgi:hypothetical protein
MISKKNPILSILLFFSLSQTPFITGIHLADIDEQYISFAYLIS